MSDRKYQAVSCAKIPSSMVGMSSHSEQNEDSHRSPNGSEYLLRRRATGETSQFGP